MKKKTLENENFRILEALVFFMSLFVLAASCYLQWVQGLEPCPLCIMQRASVFVLALLSGLSFLIRKKKGQSTLLVSQGLVAMAGLYFAGRQLWLQTLSASEMPSCLPGLDVLMQYFSWTDVLQALFLGGADCSEVTWQWLGLSMAAWSALYFCAVLVLLVFVALFKNVQSQKGHR